MDDREGQREGGREGGREVAFVLYTVAYDLLIPMKCPFDSRYTYISRLDLLPINPIFSREHHARTRTNLLCSCFVFCCFFGPQKTSPDPAVDAVPKGTMLKRHGLHPFQ
jgi:hypothetical protein